MRWERRSGPRHKRRLRRYWRAMGRSGRVRAVIALIVIVGALLPWFSIGDHPLTGRSEGRYGWTSVVMSRTGDWLVPMYLGHPHLTKPPMIYWMQAASVKVFGANEFAVRLPSAVAGSIAVVLVFVIGRRLWGARRGAIAAALYAVMPIHVVIARMAVTDSVLNVLWIGALAAGYRAVEARSRGWSVAMWGCVAAGLIVKGPVALIPVGVLIVWLALGGRWRETARLGFLIGLPIAVAPILAWVIAVVVRHPEAVEIWRHEMVDRATGAGDAPDRRAALAPGGGFRAGRGQRASGPGYCRQRADAAGPADHAAQGPVRHPDAAAILYCRGAGPDRRAWRADDGDQRRPRRYT